MINKVVISCFTSFDLIIGPVSMHKIEFIPSFLTKIWLFSSKSAENSENGYLGFLTIIKESNVFI